MRTCDGEDAVGEGSGVARGANVVDAQDVRSGKDGRSVGCGSCVLKRVGRFRLRQGVAQEAFAREAGEQREVESAEPVELREQGEIFIENLAEAEAGVEDDCLATNAGGE